MKDKIKPIIDNLKEKVPFLKTVEEKVNKLIEKLPKKKKKKTTKKSKFQKAFDKFTSYRFLVPVFAAIVSIPALVFFVYTTVDYFQGKYYKEYATKQIIRSNLRYATSSLLRLLKERPVKRKHLRKIIKQLNEMDEYGRIHVLGPCEEAFAAYGETPAPGNVVIKKPTRYEFVITAYNCKVEIIDGNKIKLKKKPQTTKKKKKKPNKHHNNKHQTKINAPGDAHKAAGHSKTDDHKEHDKHSEIDKHVKKDDHNNKDETIKDSHQKIIEPLNNSHENKVEDKHNKKETGTHIDDPVNHKEKEIHKETHQKTSSIESHVPENDHLNTAGQIVKDNHSIHNQKHSKSDKESIHSKPEDTHLKEGSHH